MTESSTHTEHPAPRASRSSRPRWAARDLDAFATRWGTSRAVVRAAIRHSGKTDFASPEEAQAIVDEFRRLDARQLETEHTEKLRKAREDAARRPARREGGH